MAAPTRLRRRVLVMLPSQLDATDFFGLFQAGLDMHMAIASAMTTLAGELAAPSRAGRQPTQTP